MGSDAIDASTVERMAAAFGARVAQFYGMTETSPFVAMTPRRGGGGPRESVGQINPDWTVMCLDDSGAPMSEGLVGEIAVKGGRINRIVGKSGLYNTRYDNEGRFLTGDLGRIAGGYLFVDGRVDDRINRGGKKIAPPAVEAAIARHPKVRRVVAFGLPDAVLGQRVAALVEAKDGVLLGEDELKEHAESELSSHMVPEEIRIAARIPTNRVGKISREDLAATFGRSAASRTPHSPFVHEAKADLVRGILSIFQAKLKVEQLDPRASFFQLGGDSLSAIELLMEVETKFGVSVPPATFMRFASAAALAAHIRGEKSSGRVRLIDIQGGTGRPHLFYAHGVDGMAGSAQRFAAALGPHQPLSAFHAREVDFDAERIGDIVSVAREYAELVRRAHRERSYALTGFSFGAHLALAIAQNLLQQGQRVNSNR